MKDLNVINELRRIADSNEGLLRPADVVEAAKHINSPLHPQFEWDDSEAAEKFRLMQARQLIRVSVQMLGPEDKPISTRVFVSLTPDRQAENGGYRALTTVMSNEQHYQQLLEDARSEMVRFQKKYAEMRELHSVLIAMKAAQDALDLDVPLGSSHPSSELRA